ncbi:MAG: LysR family carnitine catabolism transcriptional activator [Oceanicoccus sp.]|jgi:LysR family carnitine catabolism transcriptional activator
MNVTIKQMQAFVAVARAQSFAEACSQLNLSQPALSITIKNLEQVVGGKLLARTTRSVNLTPEGEKFYSVAKRLLSDWENSLDDLHTIFSLQRGKLELAAMPTFACSLLPAILEQYHNHYPDINITVHDVIAEDVVNMVISGHAELGVTFDPGERPDISFKPLFLDKFVVVLPSNHPLLDNKKLSWSALQQYSFIALQRPSSIRLLIDETLQANGIDLTPSFEAHQLVTIGRMVSQGLGISIMPALSANQLLEMGAVCRPISNPVITRNVGVITRPRFPLSVAAQAMLKEIDSWNASHKKGL